MDVLDGFCNNDYSLFQQEQTFMPNDISPEHSPDLEVRKVSYGARLETPRSRE